MVQMSSVRESAACTTSFTWDLNLSEIGGRIEPWFPAGDYPEFTHHGTLRPATNSKEQSRFSLLRKKSRYTMRCTELIRSFPSIILELVVGNVSMSWNDKMPYPPCKE